MNVNNKLSSNPQTIANAFNTNFLSVAENLPTKNFPGKNSTNNIDPLTYLQQNFNHISSPMKLKNTTKKKTKLLGLSPRANYTDRAAAAGRRS